MGANFGKNFKISIFGESHGKALGINIDGIPAGTELDFEFIKEEMARRAPGKSKLSTSRNEDDEFEILSGVLKNITTGTPLGMIIRNNDRRSKDYEQLLNIPRPSHADWSGYNKYCGYNDISGGGHFSGRITALLVFAGAIAKSILCKKNIHISSHIKSVANIEDRNFEELDMTVEKMNKLRKMKLPLLNEEKIEEIEKLILAAKHEGDSLGGVVEVMVSGIEAGIGDPFFESMESEIAKIIFSIPSVKGIEFGKGFDITKIKGSEANDEMYFDEFKNVKSYTNNNGGILGGITTGMPINFFVAIKPTASISKEQRTVNLQTKENTVLKIEGRHDPIIVPRVLVVLECATAIVVLDRIMEKNRKI